MGKEEIESFLADAMLPYIEKRKVADNKKIVSLAISTALILIGLGAWGGKWEIFREETKSDITELKTENKKQDAIIFEQSKQIATLNGESEKTPSNQNYNNFIRALYNNSIKTK